MKILKIGLITSAVAATLAASSGIALSQDRLVRGNEPMRGPANAPVTMVMFCDAQCPSCAQAQPVLDQLANAYANELRVVYRQFPLEHRHPDAARAAEASLCAHEQGRFWDMYGSMLANQSELDRSGLMRQAGDIGLDTRAFGRCMDSGRHRADWRRDQNDGLALGVSATPSFFVNGAFLEGADLGQLDAAVRAALRR
jgi:protein-disulfide isomerase